MNLLRKGAGRRWNVEREGQSLVILFSCMTTGPMGDPHSPSPACMDLVYKGNRPVLRQ